MLTALLAATAKGLIELIQFIYGIRLMNWVALIPVASFLAILIFMLRQKHGKFNFDVFRVRGVRSVVLYSALAVYLLLALYPFWPP